MSLSAEVIIAEISYFLCFSASNGIT